MIRRISLFLGLLFLCKAASFGYSGDDLRGMSELRQIAQSILVYAHEHEGKVPVPYTEVPGVAGSIELLGRTRGTLVLGDHQKFSLVDPVPFGFYTVGGVVIVGYSDGTLRYHRATDRPPWVALREGPTLTQRLMFASPILNFLLLVVVADLWLSHRKRRYQTCHDIEDGPVAQWVGAVAGGLLVFVLIWILLEMVRFVIFSYPSPRYLDLALVLIAAVIGYQVFRRRQQREHRTIRNR